MSIFKDVKRSNMIILIVTLIILLYTAIIGTIDVFNHNMRPDDIVNCGVHIVALILVAVYVAWGYKKPHGNMLRYTFFLFGLLIVFQCILPAPVDESIRMIFSSVEGLAAITITYISGRLNKIEKNKTLMVFVGVLLFARAVIVGTALHIPLRAMIPSTFSETICWLLLCCAYVSRYKEHKMAGLEENDVLP